MKNPDPTPLAVVLTLGLAVLAHAAAPPAPNPPTLAGSSAADLAKEVAGRDARHTIGVRRVQNNLRVRWAEKPPTDEQIADFARAALKRDAYVERHNIIIECSAAHVHLYGLVDTEFEKEHAEWTARGQNGVVHVRTD